MGYVPLFVAVSSEGSGVTCLEAPLVAELAGRAGTVLEAPFVAGAAGPAGVLL